MSIYSFLPGDVPADHDSTKAREKRAQDAEKIRQDFVKSHRLPDKSSSVSQPSTESIEDEY
jgi:hypothetical protein